MCTRIRLSQGKIGKMTRLICHANNSASSAEDGWPAGDMDCTPFAAAAARALPITLIMYARVRAVMATGRLGSDQEKQIEQPDKGCGKRRRLILRLHMRRLRAKCDHTSSCALIPPLQNMHAAISVSAVSHERALAN